MLTRKVEPALQLYFHTRNMCLDFDPPECPTERIILEILASKVEMALRCTLRPGNCCVHCFSAMADSEAVLEGAE